MAEFCQQYKAVIPPHSRELNCSICLDLLYDPTECPCHHVFCKSCIERWLHNHDSCPQCRQAASVTSLAKASAFITDQILNLEVKCIHEPQGCQEVCRLEDYKTHMNVCPYQMIECENGLCMDQMMLKDKAKHDAKCKYAIVSCAACDIRVLRIKLRKHSCLSKIDKFLEAEMDSIMKMCEESELQLSGENPHPLRSDLVHHGGLALKHLKITKDCVVGCKERESEKNELWCNFLHAFLS